MRNQFIEGINSPSIQFQLVRCLQHLTKAQELAHRLESVELAQKCRSPVVTDPAGEAISDTH